jgi:hypothetical protein
VSLSPLPHRLHPSAAPAPCKGYTCAAFQALPLELRSADDAALLRLARSSKWRRCPAAGCGFMVEREHGCNYMVCRCGAKFCYACGVKYVSDAPTEANVHGTQGCSCALFDAPPEEARHGGGDGDDGGARAGGGGRARRRGRRRRRRGGGGGRGGEGFRGGDGQGGGGDDVFDTDDDLEAYLFQADVIGEVRAAIQDYFAGGRGRRDGAPPAPPALAVPPVSRRPWRNGRCVSGTRCRHAASIHDCPHGRACWFWHDEDDDAAAAGVAPAEWEAWIFGPRHGGAWDGGVWGDGRWRHEACTDEDEVEDYLSEYSDGFY